MIVPNGPWCFPPEMRVATAVEMRDLGRRLAKLLRAGDLVILAGPLGAGKTTLVQGIGEGLGVRGPVTSPPRLSSSRGCTPPFSGPGLRWCTPTPIFGAASARWTISTSTLTPPPPS